MKLLTIRPVDCSQFLERDIAVEYIAVIYLRRGKYLQNAPTHTQTIPKDKIKHNLEKSLLDFGANSLKFYYHREAAVSCY